AEMLDIRKAGVRLDRRLAFRLAAEDEAITPDDGFAAHHAPISKNRRTRCPQGENPATGKTSGLIGGTAPFPGWRGGRIYRSRAAEESSANRAPDAGCRVWQVPFPTRRRPRS